MVASCGVEPAFEDSAAADALVDGPRDVTANNEDAQRQDASSADGPADSAADSASDADSGPLDGGPADGASDASAPVERPFDAIAWQSLGTGVAFKETDSAGRNAAVLYAGYNITASASQAWASALYARSLRARGVRFVYAVQGPAAVDYRGKEIANRALAASLVSRVSDATRFIVVAAHSSGAYVAAEGFYRLFRERADGGGLARGRVVYFDLDGDWGIAADPERNLSPEAVGAMRWAYFVAVADSARGINGYNTSAMRAGQMMYPTRSELVVYDARGAGCATSACVHLSLVNTRPLADGNSSYADFTRGPVNDWYIDLAATRLGM
jgi:hypothetical protein